MTLIASNAAGLVKRTQLPLQLELPRPQSTRPSRLRDVILLAGSAGCKELARATQRIPSELPVGHGKRLLDRWLDEFAGLRARAPEIAFRLIGDADCAMTSESSAAMLLDGVSFERDPQPFRGTAGVLRDATAGAAGDDLLLVANASQVLFEPLDEVLADLLAADADVAVQTNDDGMPGFLMLLRRKCLELVPPVGFFDLKEQALPRIARHFAVKVVHRHRAAACSVRTLADYVTCLRRVHSIQGGGTDDAFGERWHSAFAIVEPGASVGVSATLHDSVVLKGARVGAGATLVRSVVCPGAEVPAKSTVTDQLVCTHSQRKP